MNSKPTLWIFIFFISISLCHAQNVGIGTTSPNAKLDISATDNGVLIPRVALTGTTSASPLTVPATSTLVYNTATAGSGATAVSPGFYYWGGTGWVKVLDATSSSGTTTVSNTSAANTLTTTVNGVTGTGVPIVNSNALSLSGTIITSTVNGIGSAPLDLSPLDNNIYNSDGTLTGNRTVSMAANNLTFGASSGNLIFNPSSTGNVGIGTASPVAPLDVRANSSSQLSTGILNLLQANLPVGASAYEKLGVALSNYNEADLVFNYVGAGSTSNNFGIGFYGVSPVANFYANGNVKVNNLAGNGYRPVYADGTGMLYAISGSSSNKQVFSYTGGNQTFNVPIGVGILYVKLWGAGGGSAYSTGDGPGGAGGFVSGFLAVTPSTSTSTTTLTIIVGRGGIAGTNSGNSSGTQSTGSSGTIYGGGGLAGHGYSGTGGGRSAIQIISGTDAVTAGAGGGGSRNNIRWGAGGGGGLIGASGSNGQIYNGGSGGTQTSGGIEIWNGTSSQNTCSGTPGSQYQGGRGCTANDGSGGGGGGWYGGAGGGGGGDGPSGGGSSYISGLIPYMPIRNEQGTTVNNYSSGYTVVQSVLILPAGTDGPDYTSGIGTGGPTVTSGTTGINGGNGQVVIYW